MNAYHELDALLAKLEDPRAYPGYTAAQRALDERRAVELILLRGGQFDHNRIRYQIRHGALARTLPT